MRPLNARELNHEKIHSAQQRELFYLPFFIWYILEWLVLCLKYHNRNEAYRHIRFEEEAYAHQHDLHYLDTRRRFSYLHNR